MLSLVLARDASCHEVVVEASTDLTWADLRPRLTAHLPLPDQVYVGTQLLEDHHLLGSAPLLHGAQLSDRPRARPAPSLLELAVAEGPGAGAVLPVAGAQLRVGRGPGNDIPVTDPDLSRAHALLEIAHGQVRLTDLGSTNGTRVDEARIPARETVEVRVGQRITLGSTTIRLQPAAATKHEGSAGHAGRRAVHRAPREPIRLPGLELDLPRRPADDDQHGLPWLMMLIPIPLALVLALAFQSMFMLAFGLMSPLMMLGQYVHDRRSGKVSHRVQLEEYDAERARVLRRAEESVAAAVLQRRRIAPDLAELRAMASAGRVWPRRPSDADFGWWRVGTGEVDVGVALRSPERETTPRPAASCPVTLSLSDRRVTGVCAPADVRLRAAQSLLGQLASLHSPLFLQMVVIVPDVRRRAAWHWARRLPHLAPSAASMPQVLIAAVDDAALSELLAESATAADPERRQSRPPLRTVVVLDEASALVRHPVVSGLLQHGAHHGVAVVAFDDTRDLLPPDCEVTVELNASTRGRLQGEMEQTFTPDLPADGWARAIAEQIAPMVDATPNAQDAEPPSAARLLDVLPVDATRASALADVWASTRRTTKLLLGLGPDGPISVDLAIDGPHVLVGGTTGSGKSELLQTMIASLAVGNRPDEMVFVLVDYKGGAAFKDCARLPHTVGLVTDLDAHLTQRALTSLDAEIARRERLLGDAGAKDLDDYQALAAGAEQPLPRLVLVIDEFRVLSEELPDFIEGLVRIAAVGRSLGIHLVLATQRPAGVVSTDIRANVNLRIALRVRDIGDSEDVIGAPDAARISTRTPGRAILRSASSPTVTLQTARVGGHATGSADVITVMPVDQDSGVATPPVTSAPPSGATDLQRIVDASLEAATEGRIPPVPSPWLPSLAPLCTIDDLPPVRRPIGSLDDEAAGVPEGRVRLGLIDLPQKQQQDTLVWDLTGGHLAIVGGPRSGRTSALRTLCADLAVAHAADDLHLYVVDPSGGLQVLSQLPHTGAVLHREDLGRGARLVTWLIEEIAMRQALLAQEHHADLAEHRRARVAQGATALPRVIVALDGWEIFTEEYDSVENGRIVDGFHEVLRDGVGVGIHVLLSGGRGLLSSRVSSSLSHRICLRMADEMDLLMAGLRPAQVPSAMPAGRGLLLPDGEEVQLALLTADPSGQAQAAAVTALAASLPPARATHPRRFDGLPDTIELAELVDRASDIRDRPLAVLGVGGDDVEPVGIEPDPAWGLTALICGPARSGRTNALLTLAHQLATRGRVIWVTGGMPPTLPPDWSALPWDDPVGLWAALEPDPDAVLVLDDLDLMVSDALEETALEHLRRCRTGRGAVLAAGSTAELGATYRGVAHELRRRQSGLILQPGRHDGEVLGVRLPQTHRPVPGRGVLVVRGQAVEIQVARYTAPNPTGTMELRADLPASA